jgi:hypothetical protein
MIGLLDKVMHHRNSKISTRITEAHKPCLEGKGLIRCTWCEIELTLGRFRASNRLDQKRHWGKERLTIDLHMWDQTMS